MPRLAVAAAVTGLASALVGCGGSAGPSAPSAPDPQVLRHDGTWYRAQPPRTRTGVAAACRAAAASEARAVRGGVAARQVRATDLSALRTALDDEYTVIAIQHRPIARVCRAVTPYTTPGLDVRFTGAKDLGDGSWSVDAISTRPYTIRGRVTPAGSGGTVTARRHDGPARRATLGPDGSFAIPVRFRHVADNTFRITIDAPPAALRKVLFTAICLDCLAGSSSPPAPS